MGDKFSSTMEDLKQKGKDAGDAIKGKFTGSSDAPSTDVNVESTAVGDIPSPTLGTSEITGPTPQVSATVPDVDANAPNTDISAPDASKSVADNAKPGSAKSGGLLGLGKFFGGKRKVS